MPSVGGRLGTLAVALLLLGLTASGAFGLERLQRKFDAERGLPFSEVNSISQDTSGFLWVTAGGGLFRYDGVELRAWAKEPVQRYLKSVASGPANEVLVREGPGDSGRLYAVAKDGVRPVDGPDAKPLVIRSTGLGQAIKPLGDRGRQGLDSPAFGWLARAVTVGIRLRKAAPPDGLEGRCRRSLHGARDLA
jgi:hypothetical protein